MDIIKSINESFDRLSNKLTEAANKYEKYFVASVITVWPKHCDAFCEELQKYPYNFYQGQVIFEDDKNLKKIKDLNIEEGDNIIIGVYKKYFDDEEYYFADILDKQIKESCINNFSLKESLIYFNNIDQDLINGARDKEIPASLMTNNMTKCSKSAINNIKYFLSKGKKCRLCLGSFVDKNGNTTKEVSHVWVEDANRNKYQTHVPSNIKAVKRFKSIILTPNDLDRLEKKITKFVNY